MVEQQPFKLTVEGSSPSLFTLLAPLRGPSERAGDLQEVVTGPSSVSSLDGIERRRE